LLAPFFSIVGIADGIRDELWYDEEGTHGGRCNDGEHLARNHDDEKWKLRSLVVEVKHRMNRLSSPPPFYDEIQAIVYSLMYQVEVCEIVQVLRTKHARKRKRETESNSEDKKGGNTTFSVHRVYLNDAIMKHRENFFNLLLPRLYSIVEAVYAIREDDTKRYRLLHLLATNDEKSCWEIIHAECPWLISCDTAYRKIGQKIE